MRLVRRIVCASLRRIVCASLALLLALNPAIVWADNVGQIQGQITQSHGAPVQVAGAPTNGQVLVFSSTTGTWGAGTSSGPTTSTFSQILANGATTSGQIPSVSAGDYLIFANSSGAGVSAASTGRLIYNSGTQTFQVSLNGAAYASLQTSAPTLASVLATGNTTGANDIIASTGQSYTFASRGGITATADGVFQVSNTAGTSFSRLMFGGATSAFPALKRNSARLDARLADDSAFAQMGMANLWSTNSPNAVPAGFASPFDSTTWMIAYDAGFPIRFYSAGTGSYAAVVLGNSRGTIASPTAVADADVVGQWDGQGYIGATTGYAVMARVRFVADGTPTDNSAAPGRLEFQTVPAASLTPATVWTMKATGHLLAGTDNAYDVGAVGATRPRTVYAGTSVITPLVTSATHNLTATSNQIVFQSAGVTGTMTWTPATSGKTVTIPNLTGTVLLSSSTTDFSTAMDTALGSTRGSVAMRGVAGWTILAPGTSTHVLTSNGAGADPSYQAAGGGTTGVTGWPNAAWSTGGTFSTTAPELLGPTDANMFISGAVSATVGRAIVITGGAGTATNNAGGLCSMTGGAGAGTQAGGAINLVSGAGGATGTNGAISLTTGATTDAAATGMTFTITTATGTNRAGGAYSFTGGNATGSAAAGGITMTAGQSVTGAAGTISLTGGAGGSTSGAAGAVLLTGGAGTASNAAGGDITITSGAGQGSAVSGAVNIASGTPGATGQPGSITLTPGTPVAGNGGHLNLNASAGVGTNKTGGIITVASGNATGNATAGDFTATAGRSVTGVSGAMTLTAGQGGSTSGAGGIASLVGGAGTAGNAAGGVSKVVGGAGQGSAAGGDAQTTGGAGGATGTGGACTITSGAGGATSGGSGAIIIQPGSVTSGAGGSVNILGRAAVGGNNVGSGIGITAGDSVGSGIGGVVSLGGGNGTSTGAGGAVTATGGIGVAATGGAITFTGGNSNNGAGGVASFISGDGGGTDKNAGNVIVRTGQATGTGVAKISFQSGYTLASSATSQTLYDRQVITSQSFAGSTTSTTADLYLVAACATSVSGVTITVDFGIEVTDGTAISTIAGTQIVSASNRAGTVTAVSSTFTNLTNGAVSDTTTFTALTTTTTATVSGTNVQIKVSPSWAAGTPTSVKITYQARANGRCTLTPQ